MSTRDERGNTPFDVASFLGYKNIVLYFLKCGCDPSSIDGKGRNSFHYLLYKREYDTLMVVLNFIRHQIKEELFMNVKMIKKSYGFKHSDIKHGELTSPSYQNQEEQDRFDEFMASMEKLAVHTFQQYLKFLRDVLTQQDSNGRNPLHYAKYEKSIHAVLNIGLEVEEGMEDFKFECQQLQNLGK